MAKKPTTTTKTPKAAKNPKKSAEPSTVETNEAASRETTTPPPARFGDPKNPNEARLFHQHMKDIALVRGEIASLTGDLRNLYKVAKADGFAKIDFDIGIQLSTAQGEAKVKAKVARTLEIAGYCGKEMGRQLDLFLEPDRTPSVEVAHEEGRQDFLRGNAANPAYAPDTEQYRQYMSGFHDETEKRVKEGIKEIKQEPVAEAPMPTAMPTVTAPKSGVVMTRAEYIKQQADAAQARADAELVAKTLVPDGSKPASLFKKKQGA